MMLSISTLSLTLVLDKLLENFFRAAIRASTSPQLDLPSLTYFREGVLYASTNFRPSLFAIGPG